MHYIKSCLLLISSIFLFGCSQKIEGEAFLKRGETIIPLADIEVRVVALDKFKSHIKSKQNDINSEVLKINSKIKSLEEINTKLDESNKKVLEAWRKALIARIDSNSFGNPFLDGQAQKSVSDGEITITKNNRIIEDNKKEIESLKNGRNGKFFFLPNDNKEGVVATRTQSNGKFEITLKNSSDSVLLAMYNDKYWLIKVGKDDKKINLTDSNENGLNCDVCVLK